MQNYIISIVSDLAEADEHPCPHRFSKLGKLATYRRHTTAHGPYNTSPEVGDLTKHGITYGLAIPVKKEIASRNCYSSLVYKSLVNCKRTTTVLSHCRCPKFWFFGCITIQCSNTLYQLFFLAFSSASNLSSSLFTNLA